MSNTKRIEDCCAYPWSDFTSGGLMIWEWETKLNSASEHSYVSVHLLLILSWQCKMEDYLTLKTHDGKLKVKSINKGCVAEIVPKVWFYLYSVDHEPWSLLQAFSLALALSVFYLRGIPCKAGHKYHTIKAFCIAYYDSTPWLDWKEKLTSIM